jgi:uncharacterized protein YndB with AHSA1/START domain
VEAVPERVWQALTDPDLTRRYWRHRTMGGKSFPSDWRRGCRWELVHEDVGLVVSDPEQVILEADPPAHLSYTWHTFTPQWAALAGLDEETAAAWRAEPRSKVTYDLTYDLQESGRGVTRLTVTHDGFAPGSRVLPAISEGWPAVFCSLKTLLETGAPLP